jgi:sulfatase maturation enzyme AslB (radical SAM superfamily)
MLIKRGIFSYKNTTLKRAAVYIYIYIEEEEEEEEECQSCNLLSVCRCVKKKVAKYTLFHLCLFLLFSISKKKTSKRKYMLHICIYNNNK